MSCKNWSIKLWQFTILMMIGCDCLMIYKVRQFKVYIYVLSLMLMQNFVSIIYFTFFQYDLDKFFTLFLNVMHLILLVIYCCFLSFMRVKYEYLLCVLFIILINVIYIKCFLSKIMKNGESVAVGIPVRVSENRISDPLRLVREERSGPVVVENVVPSVPIGYGTV